MQRGLRIVGKFECACVAMKQASRRFGRRKKVYYEVEGLGLKWEVVVGTKGILVFEKQEMVFDKDEIGWMTDVTLSCRLCKFINAMIREKCTKWMAFQAEIIVDIKDRFDKFVEDEMQRNEYKEHFEEETFESEQRIRERLLVVIGGSRHIRIVAEADGGHKKLIIGCRMVLYKLVARVERQKAQGRVSTLELERYVESQKLKVSVSTRVWVWCSRTLKGASLCGYRRWTPWHNLNLDEGRLRVGLLEWLENAPRDFSKIAELVADVRNETIADVFRVYNDHYLKGMLTVSMIMEADNGLC